MEEIHIELTGMFRLKHCGRIPTEWKETEY